MAEVTNATLIRATPTARLQSVLTVGIGTGLFLVVVGLISRGLHFLLHPHVLDTLRNRVVLTISGSSLGEVVVLVLLVVFLRSRGTTLHDLGFWKSSPLRGWVVSAVVTVLYTGITLEALRGHVQLAEVSAFHVCTSLVAGLSAGIVEELFFRGFVMSELGRSGFGDSVQVFASGFLFGLAHAGWGLFGGKAQWGAALGAMITTSILGTFYALTYVVSRRSLMPSIVGHVVMDLLIEPWLVLAAIRGLLPKPH